MTKTHILAAAVALAMSAGVVVAAGPSPSRTVIHGSKALPPVSQSTAAVLYDQSDNDSGVGIVSQNFEAEFDTYDNRGAEDFSVPKNVVWKISEVDVTGAYFNGAGPATSQNVAFYKSKNGLPGALIVEFNNVVGVDNGTGSFAITLPEKVKLKTGKYFVSVQANLEFNVGGQWAWENQSTTKKAPAAWVNPGDGFATGCVTYTAEATCIPDSPGDHMFTLKGKSIPVE